MAKSRKRKPGRPYAGGSRQIQYRVSDAQHAELKTEGPTANAAAKRRAFPAASAPPKENP